MIRVIPLLDKIFYGCLVAAGWFLYWPVGDLPIGAILVVIAFAAALVRTCLKYNDLKRRGL